MDTSGARRRGHGDVAEAPAGDAEALVPSAAMGTMPSDDAAADAAAEKKLWSAELKALGALALPVVIQTSAQQGMTVVDQIFLGHLGTAELGAAALANAYSNLMWFFLLGFATALDTLGSHAYGAGDHRALVMWCVCAFALVTLLVAPIAGGLAAGGAAGATLFGQEPAVAELMARFCRGLIPGMWPLMWGIVLTKYLQVQNVMVLPSVIAVATFALNVGANAVLVGRLGFSGAPLATSLSRFAQFLMLAVAVALHERKRAAGLLPPFGPQPPNPSPPPLSPSGGGDAVGTGGEEGVGGEARRLLPAGATSSSGGGGGGGRGGAGDGEGRVTVVVKVGDSDDGDADPDRDPDLEADARAEIGAGVARSGAGAGAGEAAPLLLLGGGPPTKPGAGGGAGGFAAGGGAGPVKAEGGQPSTPSPVARHRRSGGGGEEEEGEGEDERCGLLWAQGLPSDALDGCGPEGAAAAAARGGGGGKGGAGGGGGGGGEGTLLGTVRAALAPGVMVRFLRLGIPGGLSLAFEAGCFDFSTVLAGRLGPTATAAHAAALSLVTLTYTACPFALATAGAIRVGNMLGAGEPTAARRAGILAVALSGGFMALAGVAWLVLRGQLGRVFSEDPAVVEIFKQLALFAALFQISDGLMGSSQGVLRGCGHQHLTAVFNLIGFWLVGVLLAWLLCFHAGMGLNGLWTGIAAGDMATCVLNLAACARIRWEEEAKKAVARLQALASQPEAEGGEAPALAPSATAGGGGRSYAGGLKRVWSERRVAEARRRGAGGLEAQDSRAVKLLRSLSSFFRRRGGDGEGEGQGLGREAEGGFGVGVGEVEGGGAGREVGMVGLTAGAGADGGRASGGGAGGAQRPRMLWP
ncbi:hypothetical protein HYH03_015216 [Edaphochlamys debaryana]|uniref:Protein DETOXIFICATION n=1 Tax=Edaphochlamys debaryana TaxID=47281 RepID=A0A835XLM0_9CHLO|nr:hypothetical protein HYH03_015216 [Edaphochlamys debaryana]|eukprot:KAG2486121.1 hypothetical protein HYH03_015216 [Edaphochlamys debaryana]